MWTLETNVKTKKLISEKWCKCVSQIKSFMVKSETNYELSVNHDIEILQFCKTQT